MLACQSLGQGPDLVLLHGWGMNGAVWSELAEAIGGDFRLHLVELPGHGDSPLQTGPELADWARACLEAAPPRAAWVGWSLGGLLALQAALLAPKRVSRLVLVAGTPRFVQGPDWAPAMARATLEQFGAALVRDPETTLDRFLGLQVRGSDQARTTLRQLRAGFRERPLPRPEALEQGLALLLHADLRSRLSELQAPSLWFQGERDTLVPAALGDELAGRLPAAEFTLMPGAGHAPFLSHGPEFTGRLRGFLQ